MNFSIKIDLEKKNLVDVEFSLEKTLGIVGMSGSGKSLTLKAILGLLPREFLVTKSIETPFPLINGESVSFIPQNPFTSLNPMKKISHQFFVPLKEQEDLFTQVGLDKDLLERFPAELSGGQLQRAIIAIALSHKPKLLLLDEPTTALDTTSKGLILEIVSKLQKKLDFKMIFVSHDTHSVSKVCEKLIVLKDGKTIEYGNTFDILTSPQREYTKELIKSGFNNRQWRK